MVKEICTHKYYLPPLLPNFIKNIFFSNINICACILCEYNNRRESRLSLPLLKINKINTQRKR